MKNASQPKTDDRTGVIQSYQYLIIVVTHCFTSVQYTSLFNGTVYIIARIKISQNIHSMNI